MDIYFHQRKGRHEASEFIHPHIRVRILDLVLKIIFLRDSHSHFSKLVNVLCISTSFQVLAAPESW